MAELQLPDLFEAAARATINARCAPAYLHDVRGSMQALYSALELLDRSARSGGDNQAKVERACDLAKRAIGFHEKSTLGVLELLTSADSAPTTFDLEQLASDAVHFLRNDAANRSIRITVVPGSDKPQVTADRNKLQILVVGLLTAAIDETTAAGELLIEVDRQGGFAVLSLGSIAGFDAAVAPGELLNDLKRRLQPRELTFAFAQQFLGANGGKLAIGDSRDAVSVLQIRYPAAIVQA